MDEFLATSDPQAVGKFTLGVAAVLILLFATFRRRRGYRPPMRGGRYGHRPPAAGFLLVCVLSLLAGLLLAAASGQLVGAP